MKKINLLFVSLIILLVIAVSSVSAQNIQPSGKKIGADKQSNAIYQVSTNGIEVGYKLVGSGEPLVMIMGLGGTMDDWPQEVIEALSKKYQLIILDNRGMGYTTANDVTFTYKLFADDVIGLLTALGVKKANVLGYSMGSMITQELLLEYPQRLNKAIIYATLTDGSNLPALSDAAKDRLIEAVRKKAILRSNVAALTDAAKDLRGETHVNTTVPRLIEAAIHWKTPLDKLPLIKNQVMLIVGTSDTNVGVECSKTIASAIPGAWLVQFKNATHRLIFEAPTEFTRIVLTFLDINETVMIK